MRAGIFASGIVLLIVGLILTIFLWPFVALPMFGYYSGPNEIPDDFNKGDTFKCTGSLYDAESKGDYTAMIIDFDNGESMAWVEKGDFSSGERIILQFEVTEDVNETDTDEREKMEMDKDDKDEFMEGAKDAPEGEYKTYHDSFKDTFEDFGVSIKVTKTPDLMGILGLLVLIIGIILMIIGGVLKSKKHRVGQPPQQDQYGDRRRHERDPDHYHRPSGYDENRGPLPRDSNRRPPPRDQYPYYDDEPRRRDRRRPPPRDHDRDYHDDDRDYDDEPQRWDDRRPPPPPPAAHGRGMDEPRRRDRDDDRDHRDEVSKFCPECGSKAGGKKFCPECGERL